MGEPSSQSPTRRRDAGGSGDEATHKEAISRELELQRLETGLKQNSLLQFQNDRMEAQFALCHNHLLRSADTLCIAVSISFVCLSIFRSMFLKDFEQMGVKDWIRCLFFPVLNLFSRSFYPEVWRRYREVFWCADRFERLYATSLPNAWVFRCADATMFAYGTGTSLLDAIGHKVRFHVQLMLSLVMYFMSTPFMATNHIRGSFVLSRPYLLAHFVGTVAVPTALVYFWDWHMRRMFVDAKLSAYDT